MTSKKGKKPHNLQLPPPLLVNYRTLPEEDPAEAAPAGPSPPGAGAGEERGASRGQERPGRCRLLPQSKDSKTLPLTKPQDTRSTSTNSFAFLCDDSKQWKLKCLKALFTKASKKT